MRLIDADALITNVCNRCELRELNICKSNGDGIGCVAEMVQKETTIDALPVVHGHWIEDSDGDGRHCSVCGEDYCYLISDCELYNYCPHCGAKMDEVSE